MTKDEFLKLLRAEVMTYKQFLETDNNEWTIKGFIDVNKNVYSLSCDTKVVSKIIEILLIPKLSAFAKSNGMTMELPSKQNFYPDLTLRDKESHLFAVDFKSNYYDSGKINGLTLGSYWGYFRERDAVRNMDRPYNSYCSHIVIGVLYKREAAEENGECAVYAVGDLKNVHSVIKNFIFFVQPKYKISGDLPGSGNTRNSGSVKDIDKLVAGDGPFAKLGEDVFDDYWQGYFNKADAKNMGIGLPPYTNLKTYKDRLHTRREILNRIEGNESDCSAD